MLYKLLHNRVYRGEIPHKGQFHPGAHEAIIDQGLWDAAHAILAQNNRQRTSETWQRRQPEALLLGLFYTADGEKYQPAFTKKPNGKRYRYYVPNRKVRFGADASPAGRVPAEPIEQMVLAQIHAALMSPEMVQSVWDVAREKYPALTEPEVVLPLRQMGQVWAQLFPAERQRIVQLLIERVTLREEGIEITWRDTGWHALAARCVRARSAVNYWKWNSRRQWYDTDHSDGRGSQSAGRETYDLHPGAYQRHGGRKVVIPAAAGDKMPEHDAPILTALSRAFIGSD
jgi:hypothetical protein